MPDAFVLIMFYFNEKKTNMELHTTIWCYQGTKLIDMRREAEIAVYSYSLKTAKSGRIVGFNLISKKIDGICKNLFQEKTIWRFKSLCNSNEWINEKVSATVIAVMLAYCIKFETIHLLTYSFVVRKLKKTSAFPINEWFNKQFSTTWFVDQ